MRKSTFKRLIFNGEDGCQLEVYYDNRGEPFREGVCIELRISEPGEFSVFLQMDEVQKLRDKLTEIIENKKI
jgi:hypothetical protein